uniref:Uncharacterized protein n=1 Tax=Parascaris equorum TaxID=6256 RepID=A0A914S2D2_PAREQ
MLEGNSDNFSRTVSEHFNEIFTTIMLEKNCFHPKLLI